ncbi:hypothetical protein [Candidatus Electronema sp. JM]|uniref:hypothetical protein n=1 Tax=Candidatus Electronema sp. JM TaxID=3401571 RepID=UPI003AA8F49E
MELAEMVVSSLVPVLPYLLSGGGQILGGALEKIGSDGWETAKAVWTKISSRSSARVEGVKMAAEDVVRDPSEEDAQKTLHFQVKKLLQEDQELALDIARLYGVKVERIVQTGGVLIKNSTFVNEGTFIGRDQINKK